MKQITLLIFLALVLNHALAQEISVQDVQKTAASLDSLIVPRKEQVDIFSQGKWHRRSKDPIPLTTITPVLSKKLNLESGEITKVLQQDTTKLSELVLAKMVADKSGKPWRDIFTGATEGTLIKTAQAQQIPLEKVQETLNDIYADLSFAILDLESGRNPATGSAPQKETGKDKSKH